jgi:hypothetical protein
MSSEKRELPADMLLLRDRQRRLNANTTTAREETQAVDEVLVFEADAIVESGDVLSTESPKSGVALYRPLAYVSLGGVAWSGAVDNGALQNALVCSPVRGTADARAQQWLGAVTTIPLADAPHGEPALFSLLGIDDIALLERVAVRFTRDAAMNLTRAAALPSTIVGADPSTAAAAASPLAAYRHAALVCAWQEAISGQAGTDAARERDAIAVQLISILRALLGEI